MLSGRGGAGKYYRNGGLQRGDVVVAGEAMGSVVMYESHATVSLHAKALATMCERLTDTHLATHILPEEWQLLQKTRMEQVPTGSSPRRRKR